MSFVIALIAAPWLAATGIYNPQVVDRHHYCIAEPGSFDALYCSSVAMKPHPRYAKKYRAQ